MKKKPASPPAKAVVVRNSMARHPLLGKGAVHEKSGKARRRAARVALRKTEFERDAVSAASGQSPVFQHSACFHRSVFASTTLLFKSQPALVGCCWMPAAAG